MRNWTAAGLAVAGALVFASPVVAGDKKDYPVRGDKPPGHTEQPKLPDHNNEGPPGCEPSGNQPKKCDGSVVVPPVTPPVTPPVEKPPVDKPPVVTPPVVTPPTVTPPEAPPVVPPVAPPVAPPEDTPTVEKPKQPSAPVAPKKETPEKRTGTAGKTETRSDTSPTSQVQTRTVSTSSETGTLPYTGPAAGLIALAGAALGAGGYVARRRLR